MKPDQLIKTLSRICLALMLALLFAGGASGVLLAIVGAGAVLILSACFFADRNSTKGD